MRAIAALAWAAVFAMPVDARAEAPRVTAEMMIADARAKMLIDPQQAQTKAKEAASVIERIADPVTRGTARATALWLQGEAAYRLHDLNTASPRLAAALALVRQVASGSKLEGDVLLSSGSVHGEMTQVMTALSEFQRAHAIFLKIGDARNRAIALICIASLYSGGKDFKAALKYLDQALTAYGSDSGLQVSLQNNRATALSHLGRYAEAEHGFRTAFNIAEEMRSPVLQTQILRNIARVELRQNDVDGADRTIARVRRIAAGNEDNRRDILSVAAQAALQRGRLQLAASLIEETFSAMDPAKSTLGLREAHETAYNVFVKQERTDRALPHLLAMKRLDDQATQLATSTSAALMAARFDFANQELRIARLKAEDLSRRIEAARTQARVQRYIFYGGAGTTAIVITALLTGLIVVRRSRDRVRAANADLGIANAALGKALAAKTEFLATTSHEIRTPLNGILGMTQVMLADPALPETMRDRLSVMQGAGTTMRALVDDILDVAKMENGKLVLEDAAFDLKATITDATRLWDAQAGAKGIAFRRALEDCPRMVRGDGTRVRQVVFNLLSNALKFTDAGEIAISAQDLGDGRIAIAVRDSGIGISPDKLEAIFEAFRQADTSTTRQFGGTGLGLAICRQLARAMGGDVTVESHVGAGSVFTVTLPLPAAATLGETTDGASPALLLVERNPIARSMLRTLLEPHAGRVLFAGDVEAAVAAMGPGDVSRVLIDDATLRTGGDSDAGLRAIAAAAKGSATVTLLSATVDDGEQAALMATGIDCIVLKPVSGPSLVATLFRQENDPLVRRAA